MSKPLSIAPRTSSALRESCADLIRRLRHGEPARAEQYLAQFPYLADDAEAAVELIYTEFATREELGQRPVDSDYYDRFPTRRDALKRQFDIHRFLGEGLPTGGDAAPADDTPSSTGGEVDMPRRLGAYELLRPLGRGGMGIVYLARHVELGRPAALKIIAKSTGADAALAERFRAEVRSAAALGHPQIVQLYELGETPDGRMFAAFEYLEGGTLHQAIGGRPRPGHEAAAIVLELARATACAHRAGIVHCDLTSANVLLNRDGLAKIADFGLAKLPRTADGAIADETETSALAGTPGYMAPERIEHPDVANPAVDVYGLGAIFYELLTGRPPFVEATPLETLRRARDEDPPSPGSVTAGVPRDAATICLKALAREPERRYPDAAALADDLQRYLAGEPIAARPVGAVERAWKWARRRPGLAAALVATTAALAVAAVSGTWYNLRLREALQRTERQEAQIRAQAGDLATQLDQVRRSIYTLQLNQAEALVDRAPHQALALLKDDARCPPERRDFAWGWLVRRASQDRHTLVGHNGPIGAVVWNDDAIVTAGGDDAVGRWNAQTGARTATFAVASAGARRIVLSPGGTRLAAAFEDRTIRTFDFATPDVVERLLVGHVRPITALTYFPDGRWLASGDDAGQVIVWDPAGAAIAEWDAVETGGATTLAASPDGKQMAVGGSDGVVRLVDAVSGKLRGELYGHAGGVAALVFTHEGRKLVAVGALGGKITVWDVATKMEVASVDPGGSVVVALAVTSDGKRIAYATTDRDLRVVELPEGTVVAEYRGHADRIEALAFNAAGDEVVSASADRTAKLWDVPGRKLTSFVAGDDLKTLVVAFSPDGRTVAAAGCDGTIRLSDVDTGRELQRLVGHQGYVRAVRFTADGKRLLTCAEDSTVRLWNLADGDLIRGWEHPTWVVDVAIVGDDEYLSIGRDGAIRRFKGDGEPTATPIPAEIADVTLAAIGGDDFHFLANDTMLGLFSVHDGKLIRKLAGHQRRVTSLARHGGILASGDEGGVIILWDAATGRPLQTLRGHSRGVYSLAFSPDGRILASASGGSWVQLAGETKLWDVASGQVHATLDGATAPLAFDRAGRQLAVSDDAERRVQIWPAAPYEK